MFQRANTYLSQTQTKGVIAKKRIFLLLNCFLVKKNNDFKMAADSSTIEKLAVYDDRIVQHPPRYAVVRGANSVNSMPFAANTQSVSQHQYTVQVPNQGVYMDRALLWTSTVQLKLTTSFFPDNTSRGQGIGAWMNVPVFMPGRDWSLSSFPLHRLVNTMNANINNQQVTFNGDILEEVLRLVDAEDFRAQRTCPTMLETFLFNADSTEAELDDIGGYDKAGGPASVPNGAWANIVFTLPNGTPLTPSLSYVTGGGTVTVSVNALGQLIFTSASSFPSQPALPAGTMTPTTGVEIYIQFTSTEKLVLSPFVFADGHERDTGLFGLNNVMVTMNMASPNLTGHVGRVVKSFGHVTNFPAPPNQNQTQVIGGPFNIDAVEFNTQGQPFTNSRLDVTFLDPNWSEPLPPRSIVPYMDYTRYVSTVNTQLTINTLQQIPTPTLTLPYIPDLLLISVRPEVYTDASYASWSAPIQRINLQWANKSGLMSTHTPEQLYEISYNNGVDMDYLKYTGNAFISTTDFTNQLVYNLPNGPIKKPLVGGFLALRPGIDFPLDNGQSPGMVGNFVFQANLTTLSQFNGSVRSRVAVIAINSGFFATVFGTSMIVRGVVQPEDGVLTTLPKASGSSLDRIVGAGWQSKLGSAVSRVREYWPTISGYAKQAAQLVKPHLGEESQKLLGSLGLGKPGGAHGYGYGDVTSLKRSRLSDRVE